MKYIFGPVPSRRLGQSLGIDTIPLKTCNWNCVYCQLGRSKPLCNARKDYIPMNEIMLQIRKSLATHDPEEIDWITFVGSGEPTLHAGIGWLIKEVKKLTDIPVAVITNGSLLFLQSVRTALAPADAVMPSLDAGTPEMYKKINRPHPDVPFNKFLDGLIAFRKEFKNQLWVEVMLVKGVNDSEKALIDIARTMKKVQPNQVHIGTPTRPPAEKWVQPPSEEGIMRATAIIGQVAQVIHPQEQQVNLRETENVVDLLIDIIMRHPLSDDQLSRTIEQLPQDKRDPIIGSLKTSGQVQIIQRFGKQFWCAMPSVFPETLKL